MTLLQNEIRLKVSRPPTLSALQTSSCWRDGFVLNLEPFILVPVASIWLLFPKAKPLTVGIWWKHTQNWWKSLGNTGCVIWQFVSPRSSSKSSVGGREGKCLLWMLWRSMEFSLLSPEEKRIAAILREKPDIFFHKLKLLVGFVPTSFLRSSLIFFFCFFFYVLMSHIQTLKKGPDGHDLTRWPQMVTCVTLLRV